MGDIPVRGGGWAGYVCDVNLRQLLHSLVADEAAREELVRDPSAVLERAGFEGLDDDLLGTALIHYADRADPAEFDDLDELLTRFVADHGLDDLDASVVPADPAHLDDVTTLEPDHTDGDTIDTPSDDPGFGSGAAAPEGDVAPFDGVVEAANGAGTGEVAGAVAGAVAGESGDVSYVDPATQLPPQHPDDHHLDRDPHLNRDHDAGDEAVDRRADDPGDLDGFT